MRGMVAWFAENHVAANLLMLFLLLAGAVTGLTMKVEVFPETDLDIIKITTEYPGASPSEVEEAILRRIEEKIAGLAGIKRIDSRAREGWGTVIIEIIKWHIRSDIVRRCHDQCSRLRLLTTATPPTKTNHIGIWSLSMLSQTALLSY